ncbi:3'-5' exonuclease [Fimbriiglobus ruber]|uniref:DNA Pol III Epsilon Chain n=1 Tax=Fimbriiglobus ruber TaxID=1908690 RepID=A0A225DEB4_9BACT|nr:3'-5' exonuclease [Fimbriiglobus ruber]OWK35686.1 DNA Pol III Epsilon Chain [Fimbriiglobus ruber]
MADGYRRRINPGVPIPPAATAVHGIGDADVATAPPFRALAHDLFARLKDVDLAGFGVAGFDLPLLTAEFARVGLRFKVAGRAVLDALDVYRRKEPRDLASAVRFYVGRDHTGAHSAVTDVRAAAEVLDRQVGAYQLPATPAALYATLTDVDVARRFRRDDRQRIVFAFGKYAGQPLDEVGGRDPGYLDWMLRQSFLDDVRCLVQRALAGQPTSGVGAC